MKSSQPNEQSWHHRPADEVLAHFGTTNAGLSSDEAAKRLAEHGPNELQEATRISPWRILLDQFKSLVIWILIGAGVLSAVLGERVEAIAILAVVVLNALIGFYQEFNAEKSIAALKLMTAPQAKVRRDGKVVALPASSLVVGDVLTLEAGDLVAADARVMKAASLTCIESALTGESEAAAKHDSALPQGDIPLGDRGNMLFMGTSVATGTGKAVVVATAMKTELGNIAGMMESAGADEGTPLEKKLESFGRILVWAALGIVTLLFALGLMRGTPLFDLFMTSVSLAVAAVPEGLPAIVTVALALGVSRMAKRRTLVRKLSAVETLGSTNVICTDKTGTLTMGEMTIQTLFVDGESYDVTGEGYNPHGEVLLNGKRAENAALTELATIIVACNNAHLVEEKGLWKTIGDPTEGALLAAGIKVGVTRERVEHDLPKHHEIPFDSDRKRSAMIRQMPDGKLRAFLNGAPGTLLDLCSQLYTSTGIRPLTEEDRTLILAQTEVMAQRALRVLASAYRDDIPPDDLSVGNVERDLVFVGLSGMHDPPRQEAKDAVARCRDAGIRVVMITGDHPNTAAAIAREIGIASADDAAISGIELDKMSDDELRERAPHIAVYARVSAEHKLRIIHAWKANDAVVAMTGDGVNDAPAIKGADIGIAMGKAGTEVTRQAADMIITDDNFATIVAAVEEGRGIYSNIRKTLQYLLAGSTAELLIMAVCVIIGLPTPLLPIHLLWINLITDGLPALCLATDAIDSDVMKHAPRHRNESIADRGFLRTMLFTGTLTAAITFVVYFHVLKTQTLDAARSSAFAVLVFAELLRAFGARSETKPVWRISLLTNIHLVFVIAVSFGLQLLSQHNAFFGQFLRSSPMSFGDCLVLVGLGAIPLIVLEIVKLIRARSAARVGQG
jgi:Ca2+-transporting ATPase